MKLKLSLVIVLCMYANTALSICYNYRTQTLFFSELYLGNDNWFIETNSISYDNMYSWQADSMAISCKSGSAMVKKSVFERFKKAEQYFVFRSDSLVTPLHFDSQSDIIKLIFYVNKNYTETQVYTSLGVSYSNSPTSKTKAPSAEQSLLFDSYNCEVSSHISDQPSPGAKNISTDIDDKLTEKNALLECNPSLDGKAVTITIDPSFDQKNTFVAIYDMSGDEVSLRVLTGEQSYSVDTQTLLAGVYVVALKNNQRTIMTTALTIR